jgi:hypothetical protein
MVMRMVKYKFPAVEGKIGKITIVDPKTKKEKEADFAIPRDKDGKPLIKVTGWHSFGDVVIVEVDGEVKEWAKYKIE